MRLVTQPSTQQAMDITLDPTPRGWPGLVHGHNTSDRAERFREQLGLSTNKPIIMTGHQAQLWHPGILAKLFAAKSLADRVGAEFAWLVVDMDNNDALSLRVPARVGEGPMQDVLVDFVPPAKRGVKKPTGLTAAVSPAAIDLGAGARPATDEIAHRLELIHEALTRHAGEASVARQVTNALFDMLRDVIETPKVVYPSDFMKTEFFDEIRSLASGDPGGFAGGFNDSVDNVPDSGVAKVSLPSEELPMWRIDDRGRRQRARAGDARGHETLLPGGLLMTGMMRAAGCDLFIHGTGGRSYEPINDQWLTPMLEQVLAPFTTVTATLHMDFGDEGTVTQQEARNARWRAHHARHQPSMLGDEMLQSRKMDLVGEIDALPMRSPARGTKYAEMQGLLGEMRREHSGEIQELDREAGLAERRAAEHRLRTDRTWSCALHSPGRLAELARAIDAAMGA
ncbi:MAG: hypothetical protein ED559_01480 [Phycisphaera sp.]|nr:MAG: hypothetical protein ED559_01480 [Phycisphaera sp.]